ncbi:MAG: hypothetical protein KDA61_18095 [Planctomycetales bacterium]|nr:hypothetical protein [Planctomycetales bacterium]
MTARGGSDRLSSNPRTPRHGATFAEVAVATALTGVVLVAALDTLGSSVRCRRATSGFASDIDVAVDLLNEIASLPYEDPENPTGDIDLESGESDADRTDFDDVDDYDGWKDDPPESKFGTPYAGVDGERKVKVDFVEIDDPSKKSSSDTGLKRIEVKYTPANGDKLTLWALRSRHGVLEQAPAVNLSAVNWVGVQLQSSQDAAPLFGSSVPANHGYVSP